MSLFDFNGDGKTNFTEGMIGASLVSSVLNDNKEDGTKKETSTKTESMRPKTVTEKDANRVIGLCARILFFSVVIPLGFYVFTLIFRFLTAGIL